MVPLRRNKSQKLWSRAVKRLLPLMIFNRAPSSDSKTMVLDLEHQQVTAAAASHVVQASRMFADHFNMRFNGKRGRHLNDECVLATQGFMCCIYPFIKCTFICRGIQRSL